MLLRQDVDTLGDGARGRGVVTGDHDHLDSSCMRLQHRCVDALLGRILNAVEANKFEAPHGEVAVVAAGALQRRGQLAGAVVALRDAEHAASLSHEVLHGLLNDSHGRRVTLHRAELEHTVWGALEHGECAGRTLPVDREHPLVLGVEGDLKDLLVIGLVFSRLHRGAATVHLRAGAHDGNLGRRAGPELLAVLQLALGAVVQHAAKGNVCQQIRGRLGELVQAGLPVHYLQALCGNASGASGAWDDEVLDAHLTLCECAGLV
mmetsp:Transcript_18774/g.50980  ORF Transcript_18774/g.50980 Transcript_18774/m.50980 type:complete len:263 (-) Transcript_18774:1362-2150(-)